jgi:hypothetical protein
MLRSGLPHSRQQRSDLGVINPQNGHILCLPLCSASGLSAMNNLRKKFTTETNC